MKKYTILALAFIFGFAGTVTINALSQDDTLKQRTPVSVAYLPQEVTEAIQEEFEEYQITLAFKISKTDAEGLEGTTQGRSERMGTEGEKMHEGAELMKQQEMHEGAERMETECEEMSDTLQGAERTAREGMEQGSERAVISERSEEFLFTDEYDTYYEIQLEGPDVKTVWYSEDGERIENDTESLQRR